MCLLPALMPACVREKGLKSRPANLRCLPWLVEFMCSCNDTVCPSHVLPSVVTLGLLHLSPVRPVFASVQLCVVACHKHGYKVWCSPVTQCGLCGQGYELQTDKWEPRNNLAACEALDAWEETQKGTKAPSKSPAAAAAAAQKVYSHCHAVLL